MSGRMRVAVVVVGALAFGVVAGLVKGDSPGLRGGIGNLSAPWVLVGLLPAVGSRRLRDGALVGLASTLVALVAFYATLTVVLAGHLGGGGYAAELRVELAANRVYLVIGVVTGLVGGAAGAWAGRRGRGAVWLVVGVLLACEALVVGLVRDRQLLPSPLYLRWGVDDWRPYVGEALVGTVVLVVTSGWLWRRRATVRSAQRRRA